MGLWHRGVFLIGFLLVCGAFAEEEFDAKPPADNGEVAAQKDALGSDSDDGAAAAAAGTTKRSAESESADEKPVGNHEKDSPDTEDAKRGGRPIPPSQLDPSNLGDKSIQFDIGENDFWGGLVSSLAMILVSELGDKTFFIAAIMSMKHGRMVVFSGAIAALALMTVLSAVMGFAVPNLLPKKYTQIGATVLFFYFGARLLKEAIGMKPGEVSEELAEVEQELGTSSDEDEGLLEAGKRDDDTPKHSSHALYSYLRCLPATAQQRIRATLTPIFLESFTLTFLAEWGDRSQVATIVLATSKDPYGVTFGGIVGHAFCTALAVIGGRLLASKISERSVTFLGATLFLFFGLHGLFYGV